MSSPKRDVKLIERELASELTWGDSDEYVVVDRELVDERRWYNVFKYILQHKESQLYYSLCRNEATADGECEEQFKTNREGFVELTQVFPVEVTTIQYR